MSAKIAMVQGISSVKDEKCFNSFAFCTSNSLPTWVLVVRMFSQKFYNLHIFYTQKHTKNGVKNVFNMVL
jgi:hypothetical protein